MVTLPRFLTVTFASYRPLARLPICLPAGLVSWGEGSWRLCARLYRASPVHDPSQSVGTGPEGERSRLVPASAFGRDCPPSDPVASGCYPGPDSEDGWPLPLARWGAARAACLSCLWLASLLFYSVEQCDP